LPAEFVTTVWVTPVALFLTTTVAPGMTPPSASTASPERDELAVACPKAGVLASASIRGSASRRANAFTIYPPKLPVGMVM
jgi:hypothetical protein